MTRMSEITAAPASRHKNVYAAPALDKAFDVIELLAEAPEGLTLSEIAARLGRSLSELFRITVVMERRGFLVKNPETDRLVVAYKLLELSYRATPARHLTQVALPVMIALAREVGQSCHLVVRNQAQGLVLAREKSNAATGYSVRVGAVVDLATSCSGHVLLAFSPPAHVAGVLAGLKGAAARTLGERLDLVRARGYDLRPSQIAPGVTDISYPVRTLDGSLVAALTIPFFETLDGSHRMALKPTRERLEVAATTISAALGWNGALPPGDEMVVPKAMRGRRAEK